MFENLSKDIREELRLALDTIAGAPLIPEDLEPIIVELVHETAPLTQLLEVERANGKTHEFDQRTVLPSGGFEGENATTASSNSTYVRANVPLKIIRTKGGVTGFQQAASKKFVNSYQKEIEGAAKRLGWDLEYGCCWGNATGDPYQYDGADAIIATNRFQPNATILLSHIDDAIDAVRDAGAGKDPLLLIMSSKMRSKVSRLATHVRLPLTKMEFDGGLVMEGYRNVPIYESTFCRPSAQTTAPSAADSATAGSMVTTKTYKYKLAAVTLNGEQWASTEVSHTLGAGKTAVDLTITPVTGALLYKVYRTIQDGAAGSETLLTTIAARTYDGNGTVTGNVTSWTDTNADTALGTDIPLDFTNKDETIFLIDRSIDNSVGIYGLLNEQGEAVTNLIQMLQLARTKDAEEFLLLSYHAPAWKAEVLNALVRNVRV